MSLEARVLAPGFIVAPSPVGLGQTHHNQILRAGSMIELASLLLHLDLLVEALVGRSPDKRRCAMCRFSRSRDDCRCARQARRITLINSCVYQSVHLSRSFCPSEQVSDDETASPTFRRVTRVEATHRDLRDETQKRHLGFSSPVSEHSQEGSRELDIEAIRLSQILNPAGTSLPLAHFVSAVGHQLQGANRTA